MADQKTDTKVSEQTSRVEEARNEEVPAPLDCQDAVESSRQMNEITEEVLDQIKNTSKDNKCVAIIAQNLSALFNVGALAIFKQ